MALWEGIDTHKSDVREGLNRTVFWNSHHCQCSGTVIPVSLIDTTMKAVWQAVVSFPVFWSKPLKYLWLYFFVRYLSGSSCLFFLFHNSCSSAKDPSGILCSVDHFKGHVDMCFITVYLCKKQRSFMCENISHICSGKAENYEPFKTITAAIMTSMTFMTSLTLALTTTSFTHCGAGEVTIEVFHFVWVVSLFAWRRWKERTMIDHLHQQVILSLTLTFKTRPCVYEDKVF